MTFTFVRINKPLGMIFIVFSLLTSAISLKRISAGCSWRLLSLPVISLSSQLRDRCQAEDYAATWTTTIQRWFLGLFVRGKSPKRSSSRSQFFSRFRHTNLSATGCYLAGKPKGPRPASPSNGKAKWPEIIDGCADHLPSPTFITGPAKSADLIWLSELGGVRPVFQGAFEVNKI